MPHVPGNGPEWWQDEWGMYQGQNPPIGYAGPYTDWAGWDSGGNMSSKFIAPSGGGSINWGPYFAGIGFPTGGGGASSGGWQFPTTGGTSSSRTASSETKTSNPTGNKLVDVLIALGIPAATIIAMLTSGNLTSKQIAPLVAPSAFPEIQSSFGDWLQQYVGQGVPTYPGELYPDISQTILPQVWGSWNATDTGTDFLANFMSQPQQNQSLLDILTQTQQYGGPTGRATDLMNNMAQWGGTGGPGNQAMSYLMQFGAPSQAGRGVANMAQFGIASPESGGALAARAAGQPTAASNWLAPFLTLNPSYRPPSPGGV